MDDKLGFKEGRISFLWRMEAYQVDEEHGKMKKGNLEFTRSPKALHDHILGYVSHRLQCCWQDLVAL